MKRIARIAFTVLISLTSFQLVLAQEFIVSGGGRFSVIVSPSGDILTWGKNSNGQLGNGNKADVIIPTKINTFPAGISILQADGGSGGHVLALDCNKNVWAWGLNTDGQIGNGSGGRTASQVQSGGGGAPDVTTPFKVLKGQQTAADGADGSANLANVKYVSGGNVASYAIVGSTGALMSWGSNVGVKYNALGVAEEWINAGLLGNNNIPPVDFATTPVYVRKCDGTILTDIVQVDASDIGGIALTGNGEVYTWGMNTNDYLGQNQAYATKKFSACALPVKTGLLVGNNFTGVTGNLSNIVQITAGDQHNLAIDESGNVFSWGGAFTFQTGINQDYDHKYAVKVKAGNSGLKTGNTVNLDNATFVAASQIGSAVVVTVDGRGYLYTFGGASTYREGGEAANDLGGQLGQGTPVNEVGAGTVIKLPTLVNRFEDGASVFNADQMNVVSVSDGDGVFYVITQDLATLVRSIWVMGANNKGQLGIGGTTAKNYPTKLNLDIPDPCPIATLPSDEQLCGTFTRTLNAGSIGKTYVYKWTYTPLTGPSVNVTPTSGDKSKITADKYGTYKIEITRTGASGCASCPLAEASVVYSTFPATFQAGTPATFCLNTGKAQVNQLAGASASAVYTWYPDNSSNSSIGSSIGEAVATLDVTSVILTGLNKIVYVEETNAAGGLVYPKASASNVAFDQNCGNNSGTFNNTITVLDVKKDLEIDTISVNVKSDLYTLNDAQSATISINIWAEKAGGGADLTNIIGTYSATFSKTRTTTTQTTYAVLKIPVNKLLSKSNRYFIGPSAVVRTGQGDVNLCAGGTETYPKSDNIDGTYLSLGGTGSGSNSTIEAKQGYVFDIKFTTPQKFCDRIPVTLVPKCPCSPPTALRVSSVPKSVGKAPALRTVTVCDAAGTLATLSDSIYTPATPLNGYNFAWYKKGTSVTPASYAAVTAGNIPDKLITNLNPGIWILRVEDGSASSAACFIEDSISVVVNPIPTFSKMADTTVCVGEDIKLRVFNPVPLNSTFAWTKTEVPAYAGATGNKVTRTAATAAKGGNYTVVATAKNCSSVAAIIAVAVNALPTKPTITASKNPMCAGDNLQLTAATAAGATYTWTKPGSSTATSAANVMSKNPVAATESGFYQVTSTLNACKDTAGLRVLIKPLPGKPTTTSFVFCKNESVTGKDIVNNVTGTTGTLNWYTSAKVSITKPTLSTATAGTTYYGVSQTDGCEGDTAIIKVIVKDLPAKPTKSGNFSFCKDEAVGAQKLTDKLTGTALKFYTSAKVALGSEPALVTTAVGSTTYGVSQTINGCEGDTVNITVTIKPSPAKPSKSGDYTFCKNESVAGKSIADKITATGTLKWYDASKAALGAAPTLVTSTVVTTTFGVSQTVSGCESDTLKVNVKVNDLPTASIAGGKEICNNTKAADKATITLTFTGKPNFDFKYSGDNGTGVKTVTGNTSSTFTFDVKTAETFTVTELKDGNGCSATSLGTNTITTFFEDPIQDGIVVYECDPANSAGGTYKYRILFTGTKGDLASYKMTATDGANVGITGPFGAVAGGKKTWTSEYIEESRTVKLSFTDNNNCNPLLKSGLNKICSCPEVATIAFANVASGKICEQGDSSSIRLNVTTNVVAPQTFTFNVKDASGTTVATQATVPVKVSKIGLYTVTDFKGSCEGSTNSVDVKYFPSPAGKITATDDKFCQAGGDKGEIQVSVSTQSLAPYNIVVARTVGADTTLTLPTLANIKFKTDKAATYTIKSLKDANTCTAKTADINTTSAILTSVVPPTANINTPANAYADPYNVNLDSTQTLQLAADPFGTNVGSWSKFGQGIIDASTGLLKKLYNKETNPSTGVGTTKVVLTVKDASNTCLPAKDSVTIVNVNKTIPDAGPDLTICSNNLPKVLTGGPSNLIVPFETAAWINVDPIATASNEKLTINPGAPAGKYKFYYEVTNSVTGKTKDSVFVTIIAPPVADITTPSNASNDPFFVNKKGADNLQLTATSPGTGYKGKWEIVKGQGNITQTGLLDGFIKYEPTPSNGDGTTQVRWTVRDDSSACTPGVDNVTIVNVDKNIPNAGPDLILCSTTLPKVITGTPTSLIPVFETSKWTDLNSPAVATISGNDLTIPSGTAAGTYQFEFSITNTAGTTTTLKDTVKVRIDEETKVPTFSSFGAGPFTAANPYVICTPTLTLAGDKNTQTLGKNWWTKTGGSGTGTLPALDSTNNPLLSGISGQVTLGYNYKNGVCPAKTTNFVLEKLGNLTPAIVAINGGKAEAGTKQYTGGFDSPITASATKADTLCLGGTYTLKANPYNLANESGTWSLENGSSVSVTPVDNTTRTLQALTLGTSIIKWKVASTVIATCKPDSVIMTVFVRDIPSGATLSGDDFHCEGTDTLYKVIPLPNPSLPVTYTWDAGTNPGVFRTGAQKGDSTTYRMYSDAAGSVTNGTISVTPSNACGTAALPLTKQVGIRLAPRPSSSPTDKIVGPASFCATSTGASYILTGHSDVETFSWSWDNTLPIKTTNSTTDSAVITQSSHWDPNASVDKLYILQVDLLNHCSVQAKNNGILPVVLFKPVTVIAPKSFSVDLVSDKLSDKFCIPDNIVKFKAAYKSDYIGLKGTYEFFLNGNSVLPVLLDEYSVAAGVLKDADVVTVKFSPDAKQCVISGDKISAPRKMEGFVYPNAKVDTSTKTVICEDAGGVRLVVNKLPKTYLGNDQDNGVITWYKINPLNPTDSTKLTGPAYSGFSILLNRPEESGLYAVKVGRNVCNDTSRTLIPQKIRIYEKPEAVVLVNPFPVPYTEGINIYHMPVVVTKPINDILTKSEYYPNTWLEEPNNPTTLLVPEKEDKEITYILTLETGNGVCLTQVPVTVVYFLPIDIPNAFSPNGDGLNDNWVITGLGKYPNTKVKVYNRWGSSMYVDNDGYKAVWNGTHNGVPLPTGTYYYIVELKGSPDNTDQNRTGSLTLIR